MTQTATPRTESDAARDAGGSALLAEARAMHERLRSWRRTLHRWPELSFTEQRTAAFVSGVLDELGIEHRGGVARTGVVGTIEGGDGPVVGLRADMDALPITERNGTDFDSERPGLMHACGHDAHTAMLLGAAALLKRRADEGALPGSVRLLFQPSEENRDDEGKSGGLRMVEEGALEGLDAVFGLHVDSTREVGGYATRTGPMLAAVDTFELVVRGRAGHAAHPDVAVDAVLLAAQVITSIHHVVSRRLDPVEPGVITVGTVNGGTATNIIADAVTLTGTIRSLTPESRRLLHDELKRAASVAEALGGAADLTLFEGYPVTANDADATLVMRSALDGLVGAERVEEAPVTMGAEDFSYMAQSAPGCFVFLGVKSPGWEREYPVHTPTFRLDEDALPYGSAALAAAALRWMETRR